MPRKRIRQNKMQQGRSPAKRSNQRPGQRPGQRAGNAAAPIRYSLPAGEVPRPAASAPTTRRTPALPAGVTPQLISGIPKANGKGNAIPEHPLSERMKIADMLKARDARAATASRQQAKPSKAPPERQQPRRPGQQPAHPQQRRKPS